METIFTDTTREHFRMALCQVLRAEYTPVIRKQAMSLLATYFEWDKIEWTFWLHERRYPKDIRMLKTYERYCKTKRFSKVDDINTLVDYLLTPELGVTS
ncbi:MAG: hypothetical protein AAFV93_09570 [Chloroflexota bacterium]